MIETDGYSSLPATTELKPTICAGCARSFYAETETCPYCGESRQWVFDRPPRRRARPRARAQFGSHSPRRLATRAGHATFKWMLCLCVSVGVLSTFDAYHPDSVRQAVISGLAWALRVSMQATGPLQ